MIKIIKNPSNLLKEEIKILEKKLEKLEEAIRHYNKESEYLVNHGSKSQLQKNLNKLRKLFEDRELLLELLS